MSEFITEVKKFNFTGRLNRAKYWKYFFYCFLCNIIIAIILSVVGVPTKAASAINFLIGILFLPFSVRRLHDLNKSGWWMLICLVPIVNIFFGIYFGFFKGTEGPNNYGEDPLAPQASGAYSNYPRPEKPLPDDDGIDVQPKRHTVKEDVEPEVRDAEVVEEKPRQAASTYAEHTQAAAPAAAAQETPAAPKQAKFCSHCGAPLEPGAKFCGNCGSRL